jgi:hypothetical protein
VSLQFNIIPFVEKPVDFDLKVPENELSYQAIIVVETEGWELDHHLLFEHVGVTSVAFSSVCLHLKKLHRVLIIPNGQLKVFYQLVRVV